MEEDMMWWRPAGILTGVLAGTLAGVLAGCSGEKDPPDDCTSVLLSSFPADGATDVYYRTVVDAVLGRPEADATLTLTDASGNEVPGTLVQEDRRLVFVPGEPLQPGATYTSHLEWSCEPEEATFTVGTDLGDPVEDTLIAGRTYLMDLRAARYAWPPGLESAMVSFLQAQLLLSVDAADASGIQFSAGSADFSDQQDVCSTTVTYDQLADYGENPYFSVHLDEMSLEVVRDDFVMLDLTITGTFAPGGALIRGVSVDGVLDCRYLTTELDMPDADGVCNVFAAQGVDCQPCPDGPTYCIPMVLDSMDLPDVGYAMVSRSRAEIDADPVCAID